jgi:hypothetical protein
MHDPIDHSPNQQLLETTIAAIRTLLEDSSLITLKAQLAISAGSRNEAIGWLLDVEPKLKAASALYEATQTIHRQC